MSSNTFLIDAASRHQLLVQRYSNGLEKDAAGSVSRLLNKIGDIIQELYSPDITARRFNELRRDVAVIMASDYGNAFEDLADDLDDFIATEIDFNTAMYEEAVKPSAAIKTPSLPSVISAFSTSLMDVQPNVQVTPRQALEQYGEAKIKQVDTLLKDGYAEGKTHQQLSKDVRDLIPLQARQSGSLVRTLTNTASSIARFETMFGNLDIFTGYEWVSTLDSMTSLICMGRDGQFYTFKSSNPIPPAHWSCRSTIIPVVADEYNLIGDVKGERPAVGEDGATQVHGRSTYGGWLRKQPASFQNEALGPARAKLFRNGKLSIDKFTNDQGVIYDLKELKKLNPLAFERANLD